VVPGGAGDRQRRPAPPYARRRLVALVLATLVLTVAVYGARSFLAPLAEPAPAGPAPAAASPGSVQVVVQPGDSLWSIARRARPDGDIRPLVDRLVAEHGSTPLRPGEVIPIPR
jgi:hypothetical protein